MPTCTAVTKTGAPCRATSNLSAEGLCMAHDPTRAAFVRAARTKGGQRRGHVGAPPKVRTVAREDLPCTEPDNIEDVVKLAAWVTIAVATGDIDPVTAREFNRGLTTLKLGLDKRDLARRLREAEATIKTLTKGRAHE